MSFEPKRNLKKPKIPDYVRISAFHDRLESIAIWIHPPFAIIEISTRPYKGHADWITLSKMKIPRNTLLLKHKK